jgi:hypothetical protein
VSGQAWWLWVAICVTGWYVAIRLLAWWTDNDDDLAPYRYPYRDDEGVGE